MPKARTSLLLFIAAIAASASAHALTCGSTVYTSVALTADVACPPGTDGVIIGADYVRIDLNGFAITSPNTGATRGIRSSGFSGIKVVGPGRIIGFDTSVMIDGGTMHEIRKIDAATVSTIGSGIGIWLYNVSGSVVELSSVGVLDLGSDPGYRTAGNRIVGNDADSIHLHGCGTHKNEIANNDVHPATQFQAVRVDYGAVDNQVIANRVVSGTIRLGGSSGNVVADNNIFNPASSWIYAGVILGHHPSPCAAGALVPSSRNTVRRNVIKGAPIGILMADGSLKNQIAGNNIHDQAIAGLYFYPTSQDNDARGNLYSNAPVDVIDLGLGNLWP